MDEWTVQKRETKKENRFTETQVYISISIKFSLKAAQPSGTPWNFWTVKAILGSLNPPLKLTATDRWGALKGYFKSEPSHKVSRLRKEADTEGQERIKSNNNEVVCALVTFMWWSESPGHAKTKHHNNFLNRTQVQPAHTQHGLKH